MTEFYPESALRHFEDAEFLADDGRVDAAGHLIGFAVECAIKHAVVSTRPSAGAPHVHLPMLIEPAKKALRGRGKHPILTLLNRRNFMSGWNVDNRYGANGSIDKAQFQAWRSDASRAMGAVGLRRSAK